MKIVNVILLTTIMGENNFWRSFTLVFLLKSNMRNNNVVNDPTTPVEIKTCEYEEGVLNAGETNGSMVRV